MLITLLSYIVYITSNVYNQIWLSEWSNDQPVNGTQDIGLRNLRLGVYGGIGLLFGESI